MVPVPLWPPLAPLLLLPYKISIFCVFGPSDLGVRNLFLLFSFRFSLLAEGKPDGEWSWIKSNRFGEVKAKAVMKSEDGKLTGAFWLSESRKLEIESGSVDGDKIKFTLKRGGPSGGAMTYEMAGTVSGDKMEASSTQKWTAVRKTN